MVNNTRYSSRSLFLVPMSEVHVHESESELIN